jgi:hypothetical protein
MYDPLSIRSDKIEKLKPETARELITYTLCNLHGFELHVLRIPEPALGAILGKLSQ